MQKDNATRVLALFFAQLQVPVTKKSIVEELQKHPDYYSMLAFTDVLGNFGVESSVYEVPFSDINNVPLPFICYLKDKRFALVKKLDNQKVLLADETHRNQKVPVASFRHIYNNTYWLPKTLKTRVNMHMLKKSENNC